MSAPLTPPDCDLQDFPFMPLHVARLRDSDMASEEDPEACWYAVLLWAASWHQIPAASLPDNDAVLTKLIGLGRDVRTFRKHKAGAMRGFILCDDGRLYHPIVAEQAASGWRRKLEQRWRTEAARVKKRNQRDKTEVPLPTFEEFMATLPETSRLPNVPGDSKECPEGQNDLSQGTDGSCPPVLIIQEIETGRGTGRGTLKEEATASSVAAGDGEEAFEALWKAYPHVKGRSSKPKAFEAWKLLSADVRRWLPAAAGRYARGGTIPQGGAPALAKWLAEERWSDWLLDVGNPQDPPLPWRGPAEVRDAFRAKLGEDWCRTYLDRCAWQDVPERALIPATRYAGTKLVRDARQILAQLNLTVLEKAA